MELLVVRHAIAFERDRGRWPGDAERPLTPAGIRRARKAAAGLKALIAPPERVLTSPLLRARQTARILSEFAGWPQALHCPELSPGEPPSAVLRRLRQQREKRIALVGHEPGLGLLIAACLLDEPARLGIELKKNAVACVSFEGAPAAGEGTLKWLAPPRLLRSARN